MDLRNLKKEKGITLIALAVTIVVLLILAGVSINATIGPNGIISKAQEAQTKINASRDNDLESINYLNQELDNILNSLNKKDEENVITKEESFVGYFADIDGDGTVDGVIYADLAIGGSGAWSTSNSSIYSYSAVEDKSTLKNYVISQESYTVEESTGYGTKPVLKATGTGGTKDRFYVMALADITNSETTNNRFCWYAAAGDSGINEYASITSIEFGEGKNNTKEMINSWVGSAYGDQDGGKSNGYLDIWGVIQEESKQGWFVPSKAEWCAFAKEFGITGSNRVNYGLNDIWYWTSSMRFESQAWYVELYINNCTFSANITSSYSIRLSTIF